MADKELKDKAAFEEESYTLSVDDILTKIERIRGYVRKADSRLNAHKTSLERMQSVNTAPKAEIFSGFKKLEKKIRKARARGK
jgi:hypothetical protein